MCVKSLKDLKLGKIVKNTRHFYISLHDPVKGKSNHYVLFYHSVCKVINKYTLNIILCNIYGVYII